MPNFRSGAPLGGWPPQDKATAMSKTANPNRSRHATARLRSIRQRVRRSFTLGLVTAGLALGSTAGQAQMGQTAMAPAGGVVNQAVTGLRELNLNGPGYLYYGVNAADRGLGYLGSYMTLGGFIPLGEDDLGGFWSADLRSHLSVYGGFFSNVGAVRKQFIGGTLLGVGVYWDYDGDMNQYSDTTIASGGQNYVFSGGQVYNQVGVSGEWLTDYGNLRSNGYIPVGSTGQLMGPFVGNSILCVNGINAALGGADLEVGAYIPGLADWAGMISVGGYALGNTRYEFAGNQAAVPWFGGVYTRVDMTLMQNWDFSLQYNNDSFFDSTGFARLTYRMGGSRRRNVPDQVEQPMMRNEHIVRGHQTPIVATNPATGQAWNVIHVDNTATFGGNGTAAAPVQTLATAQGLATRPYDIVYVHAGSSVITPYQSLWQFQADNQILVGQGSTLELNTSTCGYRQFFNLPAGSSRPVLDSTGTAITLRNGAIVDNFLIRSAPIGIAGDTSLTQPANVNAVAMTGALAGDAGIMLTNVPSGKVNFYNMSITDVDAPFSIDGGAADVDFQGRIANRDSASPSVVVANTTGGVISVNTTTNTLQTPIARNPIITAAYSITDTQSQAGAAILVSTTTDTTVRVGQAQIVQPAAVGLQVEGNSGGTIELRDIAVNQAGTDGMVVSGNSNTTVSVDGLTIADPGAAGVTVDGNTGSSITFIDLLVTDAVNQAFTTQGNDAASNVTINGFSSLSSVSNALAAFESNDDATLNIQLGSLQSAVESGLNGAIVLNGASPGTFTITDLFRVANPTPPPAAVPGTEADDVTNNTGVTLSLPTP